MSTKACGNDSIVWDHTSFYLLLFYFCNAKSTAHKIEDSTKSNLLCGEAI